MTAKHQKYQDLDGDDHISDAPDLLVDALRKKGETVTLHNDHSVSAYQHQRTLRKMKHEELWDAFYGSLDGISWNWFLALMDECEHAFAVCKSDFQRDNQHALFWFRHTRVERERKRKRELHPEYYDMIEADKNGLDEFNPHAKFDPELFEFRAERVEGMKSHRQQASNQCVMKWCKRQRNQ